MKVKVVGLLASMLLILGLGMANNTAAAQTPAQTAVVQTPVPTAPVFTGWTCDVLSICGTVWVESMWADWRFVTVTCAWAQRHNDAYRDKVYPGTSDRCKDVDGVYVRKGMEVWRQVAPNPGDGVYEKLFDATGWHKVNDSFAGNLHKRKD